jgi:hypothetical protein
MDGWFEKGNDIGEYYDFWILFFLFFLSIPVRKEAFQWCFSGPKFHDGVEGVHFEGKESLGSIHVLRA